MLAIGLANARNINAKNPISASAIWQFFLMLNLARSGLFAPRLCPTIVVVATPNAKPGINERASILMAIWCAASETVPSMATILIKKR
jgi:hypothetical protein